MKGTKYTQAAMIAAIHAERGVVERVARTLGCESDTVRNYARRYPKVHAALTEARQGLVDLAEDGLYTALRAGEWPAVAFTLRTLGKERGYVERTEQDIQQQVGGTVEVVLRQVDARQEAP